MANFITKYIGSYVNLMAHIVPKHAGKLGFKMFGRPIRRRIKPSEEKFLNKGDPLSFQYKRINIQGYRWGQGPKKVLLLHGWQSHSARWKNLIRELSPFQYTIYAIDAPGHGNSSGNFFSAPLYGKVILHFGRKTGDFYAIIGHSLGGFSLLYALSHFKQLRTDRIIIMATPGRVSDFVSHFQKRLKLSKKAIDCISNHFTKEIGQPYKNLTISHFAEYLDKPGLIIHDKNDRFAPYTYAKKINRKWKNSELIITENLGHHLKSEKVRNHIIRYLEESLTTPKGISL